MTLGFCSRPNRLVKQHNRESRTTGYFNVHDATLKAAAIRHFRGAYFSVDISNTIIAYFIRFNAAYLIKLDFPLIALVCFYQVLMKKVWAQRPLFKRNANNAVPTAILHLFNVALYWAPLQFWRFSFFASKIFMELAAKFQLMSSVMIEYICDQVTEMLQSTSTGPQLPIQD